MTSTTEPSSGCVLCDIAQGENDRETLVLLRSTHAFAMLNLYPYNTGHTLVLPYLHSGSLPTLPPEVGADMWQVTQRLVETLGAVYRPDGFNVGMNLGRVAGAGIPDHLHIHIVPRWNGDTNFMPVMAETKVLPESLEQTWERLTTALRADDGGKASIDRSAGSS